MSFLSSDQSIKIAVQVGISWRYNKKKGEKKKGREKTRNEEDDGMMIPLRGQEKKKKFKNAFGPLNPPSLLRKVRQ
jgi:hypothetical protein